jgi:hypothetical protein
MATSRECDEPLVGSDEIDLARVVMDDCAMQKRIALVLCGS